MQSTDDGQNGDCFNLAVSTGRDKEEREFAYEALATTILTHPYIQSKMKHDDPVILCRTRD